MLDSEMQGVDRAAGILKGRRIIILGACCGCGRSMTRALTASGAQVVAADEDAGALGQIGGAVPLVLKGVQAAELRRIGKAWGEARLDGVLNLMPLRHPVSVDLNLAVLQGIVQGFMPALSVHHGQIVTVAARPDQALEVVAGAMVPALASAQTAFAHALRRDGLRLNMITVGEGGVKPARVAITGLLAGSMGPLTGAELRL
tara:strand:+ start:39584 stop:40189 length:606 start_codon:yes stop_codon:yes gene_type:complete